MPSLMPLRVVMLAATMEGLLILGYSQFRGTGRFALPLPVTARGALVVPVQRKGMKWIVFRMSSGSAAFARSSRSRTACPVVTFI